MKKLNGALCILLLQFAIGNSMANTDFSTNQIVSQDSFYYKLAFHHAPIHYQDVDASKSKSDYITRFNYDGDWRADNNWNNVNKHPLSAYVYYSVVESDTHWFIVYAFFHPQDWADGTVDQEHENDMEGYLSIISKTSGGYGKLEAIITVAHSDFYSYTTAESEFKEYLENIDGTITFKKDQNNMLRPVTCQEAKGHGLKAFPYAGDFTGKEEEDGIIYYPSETTTEVPKNSYDRNVKYKLISLTGSGSLWNKQLEEARRLTNQCLTYNKWGNLKGNGDGGCGDGITITCSNNSANLPWNWDDSNDNGIYAGMLALDPITVLNRYFKIPGILVTNYTNNVYLKDLKTKNYNNQNKPRGWAPSFDMNKLLSKIL